MPKLTDNQLYNKWVSMIDEGITIEDLRKQFDEKYPEKEIDEDDGLRDIVSEIAAEAEKADALDEINQLEEYEKNHPDEIKEITDKVREIKEKNEREKREIQEEFEKKQEEERRRNKERVDRLFEMANDTGIRQEANSVVDDIFENAEEELKAEDIAQNRIPRMEFFLNLKPEDHTDVHDLEVNIKYFMKDPEINELTEEELAEGEKAYDKIFGKLPGSLEMNLRNFSFYKANGDLVGNVSAHVDKEINEKAANMDDAAAVALAENRDRIKKTLIVHAYANSTQSLHYRNAEDDKRLNSPQYSGEQAAIYNDSLTNGYKTKQQRDEIEARKAEDARRQKELEEYHKTEEYRKALHLPEEAPKPQPIKELTQEERREILKNNTPEIEDNLKQEAAKLWDNLKVYKEAKQNILADMAKFDMQIAMAQASINLENPKPFLAMKKSVKNAIVALTDENKKPEEVRDALKKCYASADHFMRGQNMNFFDDFANSIDIARDIKKTIPDDIYTFDMANANMANSSFPVKGISEKNLTDFVTGYAEAAKIDMTEKVDEKGKIAYKRFEGKDTDSHDVRFHSEEDLDSIYQTYINGDTNDYDRFVFEL